MYRLDQMNFRLKQVEKLLSASLRASASYSKSRGSIKLSVWLVEAAEADEESLPAPALCAGTDQRLHLALKQVCPQ